MKQKNKRELILNSIKVTLLCSLLCGSLLEVDVWKAYAVTNAGQSSSNDVLNVILTTSGSTAASMGSLAEGTYTATNNTIGSQAGRITLDNNKIGGRMHPDIGQTMDMYAPSADVDYTDKIGYSGNYTFLAVGGKGGNLTANDYHANVGKSANGGYGTAVTSNSIDYSTGQSITYRKGSNGRNVNATNHKEWRHFHNEDDLKSINPMGEADGLLYGQHDRKYSAYTATAQVGTASYIQVKGNTYIVAGGGAPGAVLFEAKATNPDDKWHCATYYTAKASNGMHADITPTLTDGYLFYNPGADNMSKRYHDYAGTRNVNAGRIAGMAVKNGCKQHPHWGGGTYYEDMFYGWLYNGSGVDKISSVYPGYSGCTTRSGSVFTPSSAVSVSLNTSITSSTPTCQLKCNAKYVTINNPTRKGYTFTGWTCGSGVSVVSKTGSQYKFKVTKSNATITAQWTPITYKIRFNGNNNWNTAQGSYTQDCIYDKSAELTDNKFTRADATTYNNIYYEKGYEFIGWGTSPTQKTPTYSNKQTVKKLTTTDGAVIDLYALWKKEITLTINFNGGKFNNSTANQVLNYTMYNSELSHTFDIKQYYGNFKGGSAYANKGLNTELTKTDTNGIQYRFLGYSLNPNATIPDSQFDVYSASRTESYTIRDNTTLYAVWEPVLQMTVQLTAPQNSGTMQLTNGIPVTTTLGNFTIPSGINSTDIPNSGTASVNAATIGTKVNNKDSVNYTVSAKGGSNIKFGTAADSRILDIYTHGNNNTWFDKLNTEATFNYALDNFTSTTGSFTVPQYIGTTKSYQTSNPNSAEGTSVYALKFICTQPSYYYSKYWNSPEITSVYAILFLNSILSDDNNNGGIVLPPSAVEDGAYEFETILN